MGDPAPTPDRAARADLAHLSPVAGAPARGRGASLRRRVVHPGSRRDARPDHGQCQAAPVSGRSTPANGARRTLMSQCLGERTLWRLHHGDDDSGAHRAHLAACRHCVVRYQELGHDLDLIAETLQAPPPVAVRRRRPAGLGPSRVALAAGLATLLLVAGGPDLARTRGLAASRARARPGLGGEPRVPRRGVRGPVVGRRGRGDMDRGVGPGSGAGRRVGSAGGRVARFGRGPRAGRVNRSGAHSFFSVRPEPGSRRKEVRP